LVIVEGRYDKARIAKLVEGTIVTTEGFGVFKDKGKVELIRKLGSANGVLVITDSDAAGRRIRGFLKGILPPDKVTNAYIPAVRGRERRKDKDSAEGLLGVEGMDEGTLAEVLSKFGAEGNDARDTARRRVTKADLYERGLSGGAGSAAARAKLCERLGLPHLPPNSLLDAVNALATYEEFVKIADEIKNQH